MALGDYGNANFAKYSRGLKNIFSAGAPVDYRIQGASERKNQLKANVDVLIRKMLKDVESFHAADPYSPDSQKIKQNIAKFVQETKDLLEEGLFNKLKSYFGNLGSIARNEPRSQTAQKQLVSRVEHYRQQINQEMKDYLFDIARLLEVDKAAHLSIEDKSNENTRNVYNALNSYYPQYVKFVLPLRDSLITLTNSLSNAYKMLPEPEEKEELKQVIHEPLALPGGNPPRQLPLGRGPIITPPPSFIPKLRRNPKTGRYEKIGNVNPEFKPKVIRDLKTGKFKRIGESYKFCKKMTFSDLAKNIINY